MYREVTAAGAVDISDTALVYRKLQTWTQVIGGGDIAQSARGEQSHHLRFAGALGRGV